MNINVLSEGHPQRPLRASTTRQVANSVEGTEQNFTSFELFPVWGGAFSFFPKKFKIIM